MEKSIFSKKLFLTFIMVLNIFAIELSANCSNRVFNINVVEKVTTFEVINQLSDACDFSVVIKDQIASKIIKESQDGINIKNLTLNRIFELLLLDNDMYYSFEDNILKIYALETKTFKIDYIVSKRSGSASISASTGDGKASSSDSNMIGVEEEFDFWGKISEEIEAILNTEQEIHKAQKPIVNKNAGMLTVTATKTQLNRVTKYITEMQNRLHKQVLIEVKIISISLNKGYKTGIDWSDFGLDINQGSQTIKNTEGLTTTYNPNNSFGSTLQAQGDYYKLAWNNAINLTNVVTFSMKGLFSFLDEQGNSRMVSSPKIITLNNQQALISVGDTYNYKISKDTTGSGDDGKTTTTQTIESAFVGILLNILPEISDDGKIMLRINPSISNTITPILPGEPLTIAPNTQDKKLSTVVRVNDGETIILGGLITSNDALKEKGIPVLKDIPILGRLFGHTDKIDLNEELIFVITPRIIQGHYNHEATLRSMGYSKRIIVGE